MLLRTSAHVCMAADRRTGRRIMDPAPPSTTSSVLL